MRICPTRTSGSAVPVGLNTRAAPQARGVHVGGVSVLGGYRVGNRRGYPRTRSGSSWIIPGWSLSRSMCTCAGG